MDLVIEGCSEDPSAQGAAVAGLTRRQNGHGIIYAVGSRFCKGKVVRAQLCGDGAKLHGIGVVDWISSRIGLITGRFLDLR